MVGVVNAFTVDVEDCFQISAPAPAIAERNTDRVLSVLADHGVRGTFFVSGCIAERSPALIRRIAAAGHEIASHGFSHELIYSQTQSAFRAETARSKEHLEDLIGAPVLGYRAPSFSITRDSLWALDALIDLGFEYDSSVFPIRHDRYGIPGAAREPGTITAPSGRRIAEFPMAAADYFGVQVPVSGGGYFRIFPYWLTRAGLRRINSQQSRPFVFYVRPWDLETCEARLRRLLAEFRFAPVRDVLESRSLMKLRERVPTVQPAPPPDAPYVGPERRRVRMAGQ